MQTIPEEQIELDLFSIDRLPRKPYCTDDLGYGVKIRPVTTALKLPYIQANPPHLRFFSIFDVDREGGALAWEYAGLPPPAWAAVNRENGHAHIAWALTAPVLTGDGASDAPLRYLAAIEAAFREEMQADGGYTGLITKNPVHPRWSLYKGPQRTWELGELAEYVDLDRYRPKKGPIEEVGLMRNVRLFDWLRQWAYEAVRRHRVERNYVIWQAECYYKSLERNGDFRRPMDPRECYHIAKSVAKWTWARDRGAWLQFKERQACKGAKGGKRSGEVRREASEGQRASARLMRAKGMSIRQIAQDLGIPKTTISRWCSDSD